MWMKKTSANWENYQLILGVHSRVLMTRLSKLHCSLELHIFMQLPQTEREQKSETVNSSSNALVLAELIIIDYTEIHTLLNHF